VVVGEFAKSEFPELRTGFPRVKSIEEVLENRLGPLGVPVLYGLPLGHGKHIATLPLGVTCTLDADARVLTVDEPAVRA
jgi:muramoyltetrapeptide carboxypeptidase